MRPLLRREWERSAMQVAATVHEQAEMSLAPARLRSRGFGFEALLVSLLALIVFVFALRPMADPDIWWHIRNAQTMLASHKWIRSDTYAYTTVGMPWIDHEWLAELPFSLAFRAGGTYGLFVLTALLLGCIFGGVYLLARKEAGSPLAAWTLTLVAVVLGTVSYGPRTLLFGWVCLVCELLLLAWFEHGRRAGASTSQGLWLLPVLFALWINLHGSWLIGIVVLAVYISCGLFEVDLGAIQGTRWRPHERRLLLLVLAGSLLALLFNPYGYELIAYPFDLAFKQTLNVAHVQEWQPLDSRTLRARVFLGLLGFGFAAQVARRRIWAPHQLAFCFLGVYAALVHTRFLFLAAILSVPCFARDLALKPRVQRRSERTLLHLCLLGLAIVSTARVYHFRKVALFDNAGYPARALPFLRRFQPQGPLLNDYLWGGYLEMFAPNLPVFIDSRVDIFERRGVFQDYLDVLELKKTLAVLDKDKIRYVLFSRDSSLAYFLEQLPAWKIDYQDETTILFERSDLLLAAR